MLGGIVFTIGSILKWGGFFMILRGIYFLAIYLISSTTDPTRPIVIRKAMFSFAVGVLGLIASMPLVSPAHYSGLSPAQAPTAILTMPIVWFVLPFTLWCLIVTGIFVISNAIRLLLETDRIRRIDRLRVIGVWLLFGLFVSYYYFTEFPHKFLVFKGVIPFSFTMIVSTIALALISIIGMAMTSKTVQLRGMAKTAATHLALIVGSFIFGIPFVWLVLTSFKEDIDLASPHGIVWIPKVTDTVPYMAPLSSPPRYAVTVKNEPLVGEIEKNLPNNMVLLRTERRAGTPGRLITVSKTQLMKIPAPDPNFEGIKDGVDFVGDIQRKHQDGSVTINVIHPQSIAGRTYRMTMNQLKQVPTQANIVTAKLSGHPVKAMVITESTDGTSYIRVLSPLSLKGVDSVVLTRKTKAVRHVGLKWQNYPDALDFLPPSTHYGLTYLQNTLILVVMEVIGTVLSCSIVAYAFSRMRFPGKNFLFTLLLSTMMLPGAVTLMPTFIIFRYLGWINTLKPLWVPAFFASAFNVFMLRQFLSQIPMELEDAAKIDGCTYLRTFWQIMLPQIKPALAVIAIWTFMGAWNDFMGPLIYITSPSHMPLSYALQLYNNDHGGETGLLMAFATLTMLPVLALFAFTQKYFIEGVTLSGFGGR